MRFLQYVCKCPIGNCNRKIKKKKGKNDILMIFLQSHVNRDGSFGVIFFVFLSKNVYLCGCECFLEKYSACLLRFGTSDGSIEMGQAFLLLR